MGLLDEAIREHLELKRRRGADPGEIAKQEGEALGPARRTLEAVEGQANGAGAATYEPALDEPAAFAAEPELAADPPPVAPVLDPLVPQEEPPRPHGDPADHLPEPEAPPVRPDHAVPEEEPPRPHGDPADELPAAPPRPQPTQAFDAEEVRAATAPEPVEAAEGEGEGEGEGEDEDVLEETPEFLQETPEHDRLWFEQRPPRDFDF